MKYVNAISTEMQFRLFGNRSFDTTHRVKFMADNHFYDQLAIVSDHWGPNKYYIELGIGDAALSGPSIGLPLVMLVDSLQKGYDIPDKYVFTGQLTHHGEFIEPGDIQGKLPYLTPNQFLVVGDSSAPFRGGVFGLQNQIIRGELTRILEYFRAL